MARIFLTPQGGFLGTASKSLCIGGKIARHHSVAHLESSDEQSSSLTSSCRGFVRLIVWIFKVCVEKCETYLTNTPEVDIRLCNAAREPELLGIRSLPRDLARQNLYLRRKYRIRVYR